MLIELLAARTGAPVARPSLVEMPWGLTLGEAGLVFKRPALVVKQWFESITVGLNVQKPEPSSLRYS